SETASETPAEVQEPDVPEARSLAELLDLVKQGWGEERKENKAREARFRSNKADQHQLLKDAKVVLAREEARSERLESTFQVNELRLAELEETYTNRLGSLGELFGVVRQVAGDARGHVDSSLVTAEIRDDRGDFLLELGKSKELPSIEKLERLWYELQREMTEQGKVARFNAPVLTLSGSEENREVVRAGVFSAIAGGKYVLWDPDIQNLRELARQPPSKYVNTVGDFEGTTSGIGSLAVDPSRGSLLSLLVDTPDATERVQQGGAVGYMVITLGVIAVLIGLWRYAVLVIAGRGVAAQRNSDTADEGNPLGRVLAVYEANREVDAETLELKLDEAVMKETSYLERFIWLVKVVSVVAPLMGLLGTVTGMIQTFQAITLFGAGDPKMMAGGISEALVTTMLGLMTAIPLVLLHAFVSNAAKKIIEVLDEQSAGLIAERSEQTSA
ncbi:MAG: MotA/TolQ/ExbB proton channel family protein, partial [Myxococcota bacterium]